MKIAICEDHKNERDALCALLEAELFQRKISGKIICFESGEDMLDAMSDEVFPMNFLDIYMVRVSGIDVAREIRARDNGASIVFTTTSREHMADGYVVGAVHYLVKPYVEEAVSVAFDRCLRAFGTPERFIEITTGGEKRLLLLSQIWWVESQNQSSVIRLRGESLRVYLRLDELLARLSDPRFLHCHKSFIVNLDHAASMKGNDFVMKDGSLVPIRREDKARIRQHYQNYNFDKIRGGNGRA